MRRKVVALGLAVVLCLSTSLTAFAESTSPVADTGSSSSDEDDSSSSSSAAATTSTTNAAGEATSVEAAKPGEAVSQKAVTIAIASSNGTVSSVSLETKISNDTTTIVAAAAAPASIVSTVQSLMSAPASATFTATVQALAEIKGSSMVVNNMGTKKTAATAKDAFGNTLASAGVVKNVTSGCLIMLMSVNADGTVEYVEGIVDPVTGQVIGAFAGTPSVITILVLA